MKWVWVVVSVCVLASVLVGERWQMAFERFAWQSRQVLDEVRALNDRYRQVLDETQVLNDRYALLLKQRRSWFRW